MKAKSITIQELDKEFKNMGKDKVKAVEEIIRKEE